MPEKLYLITGCTNVYGCNQFIREFNDLYKKDPETKKQYLKWIARQFTILENLGIRAILQQKAFEKLSGIDENFDLYSLRRPETKGNPRLLFSMIEDEDGEVYIFLLAFKELHDNYNRHIPTTIERMKNVIALLTEENGDNEED